MTITIPPEALEAAARRIALDTEGSDEWWTLYMRRATAAILAMLEAWPDAGMSQFHEHALILPLTENTDAEA